MSDSVSTSTPRGPRHKQPSRQKRRNGDTPTTPGRSGTPRQGAQGDHDTPGYHSSSGRLQRTRNANTARLPSEHVAFPVSSFDGTASPSFGSKPIPIQARDENHTRLTTPAKQAYAGPTFHASPAPSSLPMPKFFSKSLPARDSPASTIEHSHVRGSPARSIPQTPSPTPMMEPTPIQAPVHREASPLDILFNAHRAEQARQKLGESGQSGAMQSPLPHAQWKQPEPTEQALTSSPTASAAKPSAQQRPSPHGGGRNPSRKEIFIMEVDDADTRDEHEPQKALSFEDRIRAVQVQAGNSRAGNARVMDEEQRLAKSIALKQLLKTRNEEQGRNVPELPQFRESQPHTAQGTEPDIKTMEENLRKLLKLNP